MQANPNDLLRIKGTLQNVRVLNTGADEVLVQEETSMLGIILFGSIFTIRYDDLTPTIKDNVVSLCNKLYNKRNKLEQFLVTFFDSPKTFIISFIAMISIAAILALITKG